MCFRRYVQHRKGKHEAEELELMSPLCPCCQAMTAAEVTLPGVSTVSAPGGFSVSCCACQARGFMLLSLTGQHWGCGNATPGNSPCTVTSC